MTEQLFNEIIAWQKETFGQATAFSKIEHLKEEIEELAIDIAIDGIDKRLEFADCFFLLFGAAAEDGMTYQDICQAIQEKFEINKARKWGKPDENGVVRHNKKVSINILAAGLLVRRNSDGVIGTIERFGNRFGTGSKACNAYYVRWSDGKLGYINENDFEPCR